MSAARCPVHVLWRGDGGARHRGSYEKRLSGEGEDPGGEGAVHAGSDEGDQRTDGGGNV